MVANSLKQKIKQILRLGLALQLVWQSSATWTIVRSLLLIFQGILPLLSLYLMKLIVDAVATGITNPNKQASLIQLGWLIGITCIINLINGFCNSIAALANTAQSQKFTDYMYGIIHGKAIEIDLEYYENSQYYDTLQRAQREAFYRPTQILNSLLQVGQNGFLLLGIVGWIIWLDWKLATLLFIATIPGFLVRLKYANQMYVWHRQRTATERKANYLDWMISNDWHAKEIRLFNLGAIFSRRFRKLRQQLHRENIQIATKLAIRDLLTQTTATIIIYASYGFIAYQTLQGTFSLGDLVMYYQAFQRGQSALQGMLNSVAGLYEDNLFLSNLREFLDLKLKIQQPQHPHAIPQLSKIGLKFDRVSFQYPNSSRQGIKNINLTIKPGEIVALVGENGAGKTTLIKLLCRLYDPSEGVISFEGIDLRQLAIVDLRRQISVVFQDYVRYYLTARENIWLGNIDLSPDDQKIDQAACMSGADDAIASLPKGYETMLGQWFEQGEELSIGQWQKIALARAFLRDAQIVILDEPTSALDAKAEDEVFQKFRQLIKNKMAIIISHRLSTVKMADRIFVLENGKIVESGSHDELLGQSGIYAKMFETQAQNYR